MVFVMKLGVASWAIAVRPDRDLGHLAAVITGQGYLDGGAKHGRTQATVHSKGRAE